MPESHSDDFLTPAEVADQWKVSLRTVQRYIGDGRLKAVKLPSGRYRIRRGDVADAIKAAS